MGLFSGPGVTPSLKGLISNQLGLASGQTWIISPAGWYMVRSGKYTAIQQLDPITQCWRTIGGGVNGGGVEYIYSDGVNYRLANLSGTVQGGVITNAGSSYTSAPVVTSSAGSVQAKCIIGGAISTTVTITNGGANYTYPPIVVISAPPPGGIQATGYCALTSGAVSSVTIVDQGAGYTTPPTVTFFNDPREVTPAPGGYSITTGYGAAAALTLTGANTITGFLVLDHGLGARVGTETFTLTGGGGSSGAVSAIFALSIVSYTLGGTNTGWANFPLEISAVDVPLVNGATYVNPTTGQVTAAGAPTTNPSQNLVRYRRASIEATPSGGIIPAATSAVWNDGGIYSQKPTQGVIVSAPATTPAATTLTLTMGGLPDTSYITPV